MLSGLGQPEIWVTITRDTHLHAAVSFPIFAVACNFWTALPPAVLLNLNSIEETETQHATRTSKPIGPEILLVHA